MVNPSKGIDPYSIRGLTVGVWGCRVATKGRLSVIYWVCELVQIDKNVFEQVWFLSRQVYMSWHQDNYIFKIFSIVLIPSVSFVQLKAMEYGGVVITTRY